MRQELRLALPSLPELDPDGVVAFALVGRDGQLLRGGELPLRSLGALYPRMPVVGILRESDAISARVTVPPVGAARLRAAVLGSVEPMALSELDELVVAHGPRADDGSVQVAWAARDALRAAWMTLAGVGLRVDVLLPQALAVRAEDDPDVPLSLPVGPRWLAPLPRWSLAEEGLRPASGLGPWRRPLAWAGLACAVWLLGLNAYAARLDARMRHLQDSMQAAVAQAFPQIPVIIDPLRQAMQERDARRQAFGGSGQDDFMPLARAAAQVLGFAQGHVRSVAYRQGTLSLVLAEGYVPPANEAALAQAASVQQIHIEKDPVQPHVWHARRTTSAAAQGGR